MPLRRTISVLLLTGTGLSAGCGGAPALPPLPSLQLPTEASELPVSTTLAYTRIAQGAMSCWFGPSGRLARSHIFDADADPPSRGGAVEVVVHERAFDQPKPWGYKAFRISLKSSGDYTSVAIENLRMPDGVARQMRSETLAWAGGAKGCMGDATGSSGSALLSAPPTSLDTSPAATQPVPRK